jgi:predicted nucleic acid-binding protein
LILLDTSVAIPIRDGDAAMFERLRSGPRPPAISILTEVELLGGACGPGADTRRRRLLDLFLGTVHVLPFTAAEARAYAAIVEAAGFSRRKLLDRLIAATALVRGLPLATMNRHDFAEVPGLRLVDWGASAGG